MSTLKTSNEKKKLRQAVTYVSVEHTITALASYRLERAPVSHMLNKRSTLVLQGGQGKGKEENESITATHRTHFRLHNANRELS